MNLIEEIQHIFESYLQKTYSLSEQETKSCTFELNVEEQKQQFGDVSSNAALILSKKNARNPREIAQEIIASFNHKYLQDMTVAGAGFINAFLTTAALQKLAQELFKEEDAFFKSGQDLLKQNYNIEFVSANPTGPLHFGHGRGGIIGDVLGNILTFLGQKTTKEYYINDAGAQIQKLGISFKIRCQQQLGMAVELPEDAYHGDYLIILTKKCIEEYGKDILEKSDSFFTDYAKNYLLEQIKKTLSDFGITFDVWFSESELHKNDTIKHAVNTLKERGYVYEKDNALWFKATAFGDEKDRVIRKTTGEWTYIAPDIAYLINKVERGFTHLIMVLGYDHHSYAVRLEAIRQALGIKDPLSIILYQLVKIKASGKLVRMSKRAGHIITLQDIVDTVGKDVARFFYLNRKADSQLEFDIDLALKKTEENPVYYVQYAYVRTNSILEKAAQEKPLHTITHSDITHIGREEAWLLKKIVSLKSLLHIIAINYQTHLLTYYLIELATIFHRYYSKHRIIEVDSIEQSRSRLLLTTTLNKTLALCLDLLGLTKPQKM
jgi:arginyl-tRNA synthetase